MRDTHNSTLPTENAALACETPSASNETLLIPAEQGRPQAYLAVAEISEELEISLRTGYYLVSKNEIPHVRVGRSIRIYRETFEKWRREQEESSKKKAPPPEKVEASDPSKGSNHAIVQC